MKSPKNWFRSSPKTVAQSRPQEGSLFTEKETYYAQHERLVQTCLGKYVLIHGSEIKDAYDSHRAAMKAGYDAFGPDTPFLVQQVTKEEIPSCYLRTLECVT